ncbi:Ycf20-like protein, partial [Cucurbita argyrosperma subsp. argyrosperma]
MYATQRIAVSVMCVQRNRFCDTTSTFQSQTLHIEYSSEQYLNAHSYASTFRTSRHLQQLAFALDTGGVSSNGGGDNLDDGNESNLGRTRLGRLVSAANALATILGQTGDWDVLVAGVVVAAIEWIGILMYKKPPPLLTRRLKSLIVLINYWKAGVCLGLFVDAFKLGS